MIARIEGTLLQKDTESVIIDVAGLGYEVIIPLSTFYKLPDAGERAALLVHTNVREDAIQLFGFLTSEEKAAFQLLIGVSGIGPRLARNILSGVAVDDLFAAISASDRARLSGIPGIGLKTAERMILELKDKVKLFVKPDKTASHGPAHKDVLTRDLISALENLGYKAAPSEEAVKKARTTLPEGGFEALLREALKALSKR